MSIKPGATIRAACVEDFAVRGLVFTTSDPRGDLTVLDKKIDTAVLILGRINNVTVRNEQFHVLCGVQSTKDNDRGACSQIAYILNASVKLKNIWGRGNQRKRSRFQVQWCYKSP